MQKSRFYWATQLLGWLVYFSINFFFFYKPTAKDALFHLLLVPSAIALTNGFRYIIIIRKWLQKSIAIQIVVIMFFSFLLSILFFVIQFVLNMAIFGTFQRLAFIDIVISIMNFWSVFLVWSVLYFSFHYILNFRKAEIEQLKMQAFLKEAELNKLKSQLNPHFMFNAMNSIRALVDENPQKAKQAVTQLSNILRQTLTLEKNKLIRFSDEMNLVKDYLALEKIRYEERLHYTFQIDESAENYAIPPMLIQTLVENAIKHGISKLPTGGTIDISAKQLANNQLEIKILNSGKYDAELIPQSGYGIQNTRERLRFVFSTDGNFSISNENDKVKTTLIIPFV